MLRPSLEVRHTLVRALAIVFAGAAILYSVVWMWGVRQETAVGVGLETRRATNDLRALIVTHVESHGPAAAAGLKPGDRIVAVNGKPIDDLTDPVITSEVRARPGQTIRLQVQNGAVRDVTLAFVSSSPPPLNTLQRIVL